MRVVIVGGGIGGLAAALALARGGADVQVLERAEAFSEVGAGLQLAPNATRILATWGLGPALEAHVFAPEAVEVRDVADGRLLLRTPLGADGLARWGAPYWQLHRADLHAALLDAAHAAGARLACGQDMRRVELDAAGVQAHTDAGQFEGEVLIAADGLHSPLRQQVFGQTPARFTGEVAWRGLVRADRLPAGLIAPAATVWTAPERHFVHYFVRGGEWVSFAGFGPERRWRGESWREAAEPGELAAAFAGWPTPVSTLVEAVEMAGAGGWRWALHDRAPLRRWTQGRVGLLGDAAHPMAPFLAQGAGMAIEDAESLARHLLAGDDPTSALAAYAYERRPRIARVRAWAARNGRVFHLPTPLRRAAFRVAGFTPGNNLDWLYGYHPPGT